MGINRNSIVYDEAELCRQVQWVAETYRQPALAEINALPGLSLRVSCLCIVARADGFQYTDLISEILYLAMERTMPEERSDRAISRLFQTETLRVAVPAWDGL